MIAYELWETQTGNLMASYDDEHQALRAAAACAQRHGSESLESVALIRVDGDDEDGAVEEIAAGRDLFDRARGAMLGPTKETAETALQGTAVTRESLKD